MHDTADHPAQVWDTSSDPPEGTTYTTVCGRGRLRFDRAWGRSKPWCSFRNGTAGALYPTLTDGVRDMERAGWRFARPLTPRPFTQDDEG